MNRNLMGLAALVLIIAGIVAYRLIAVGPAATVLLKGYVGGEKAGLLQNEKVLSILARKYKVRLDWSKAGSMEMVRDSVQKADFLWPSSEVALAYYKMQHGNLAKSEIIFNSPIVIYSWDIVADALARQKIVTSRDGIYYITDLPRLVELAVDGKKWSDIGLSQLYGKVTITSTDPNKSNSGAMFAGLLASVLCGDVTDSANLACVLPKIKSYFLSLGYMEHSSGDLFQQYLSTGVGAKPMIVGYESQIIEFSMQNAAQWPTVKTKVRILYPEPTVWSAHPLIMQSPKAEALKNALLDPEVQKISWEQHGFRTGMMGAQNDPKLLSVVGIPAQITKVIPMPSPGIMDRILNSIQGQ
jgi:hypothetical protein